MPITDILMKMPGWYILIIIVFSLYYAVRGIIEQVVLHDKKPLRLTINMILFYIQEFLFKVIFTISAFIALFAANYIFSSVGSFDNISIGTSVLLIFLIIWGISGASGYLTFLIITGKLPGTK